MNRRKKSTAKAPRTRATAARTEISAAPPPVYSVAGDLPVHKLARYISTHEGVSIEVAQQLAVQRYAEHVAKGHSTRGTPYYLALQLETLRRKYAAIIAKARADDAFIQQNQELLKTTGWQRDERAPTRVARVLADLVDEMQPLLCGFFQPAAEDEPVPRRGLAGAFSRLDAPR